MNNIINISYDSTSVKILVFLMMDCIILDGMLTVQANMWRIDLDDINISMNIPNLYGCTDSLAINFNPNTNIDDGSCVYCIYGCMDSNWRLIMIVQNSSGFKLCFNNVWMYRPFSF